MKTRKEYLRREEAKQLQGKKGELQKQEEGWGYGVSFLGRPYF